MPVTGPTVAALVANAPTAVSVGVASALVLPANPARVSLRCVNTSAERISFGLGVDAVLDSGMTLMPSGGVWNMDSMDYTTAAIFAIASGASANLAIQEFI
jgi:hypothetical protein